MFTGQSGRTPRERCEGRNDPLAHSVLAVFFQRNLVPTMTAGDGVSTYLALIFGTLLSSQGTVASFVLPLSGFPPGFPSVFPTLSDSFVSDCRSAPPRVSGILALRLGFWTFARRPFDIHYVSRFPRQLIIESPRVRIRACRHAENVPAEGMS